MECRTYTDTYREPKAPAYRAFGNDSVQSAGPRMHSPAAGKQWGEHVTPRFDFSSIHTFTTSPARILFHLWASRRVLWIRAFLCRLYASCGNSKFTLQSFTSTIALTGYLLVEMMSSWGTRTDAEVGERDFLPIYLGMPIFSVSLTRSAWTPRREARYSRLPVGGVPCI